MQVVINKTYGGFSLSDKVKALLRSYGMTNDEIWDLNYRYQGRADERLIRALEETDPSEWGGYSSSLKIVEIPDDVNWTVQEYDGKEWVQEVSRRWS